jgi:hypothetical protein
MPYDTAISELKELLETHEGHNQLRLSYQGKPLKESLTFRDYGIANRSNLISQLGQLLGGDVYYLSPEYLDPGFDFDFTKIDDKGQVHTRGGLPYHRPCGWNRIALKVNGRYENDVWMGSSGADGEWAVSYHGTDKNSSVNIATEKYQLAKCSNFLYGKGIYSAPRIETTVQGGYAKEFQYEGHNYLVVMQNRVNPRFLNIVNSGHYYVSPIQEDIRPYGVLIKRL